MAIDARGGSGTLQPLRNPVKDTRRIVQRGARLKTVSELVAVETQRLSQVRDPLPNFESWCRPRVPVCRIVPQRVRSSNWRGELVNARVLGGSLDSVATRRRSKYGVTVPNSTSNPDNRDAIIESEDIGQ